MKEQEGDMKKVNIPKYVYIHTQTQISVKITLRIDREEHKHGCCRPHFHNIL